MNPKILFLAATGSHEELLKGHANYDISFIKTQQRLRQNIKEADLMTVLESAEMLLKKEHFDALYTSTDLGSLFLGILCNKYGFFGPSLEATFACYNKFTTRRLTTSPVEFAALRTDKHWSKQELLPFPFYLKAPQSSFGILGYTIHSADKLEQVWPIVTAGVTTMNEPLAPLFETYLNQAQFPEAFQPLLMMESIVKEPQITLEAYIHEGRFHPVIITDTNFDDDRLIDNFSIPTVLTQKQQEEVFSQAQKDITAVGLNNTFCNIEYWITSQGPKLIEINARSAATFRWIYEQAAGIDIFTSGFQLALGQDPKVIPKMHQAAGQFNIITKNEGLASNLMDYKQVEDCGYRFTLPAKPDHVIKQISEHGVVLAQIELAGKNHNEIKERANKIRKTVLRS